jgi:hypothetical protein
MGRTPNLSLLWKVTDSWRLKDRCARGQRQRTECKGLRTELTTIEAEGSLRLSSTALEERFT